MEEWASGQGITLLPFAVHSVSSLGLEAWFAAVGLGAAGIVLLVPESTPAMVVDTLTGQAELAEKILGELGHNHAQVRLLHGNTADLRLGDTAQSDDIAPDETWTYPAVNPDPRARMQMLFDRLLSLSHQRTNENAMALPAWATLGSVELDTNACTMGMACTSLCPTGALRSGHDGMELDFIEAACVQCGLCEHGCPEGAIKRQPRFDYQALRGSNMTTLHRAQMANCKQCGRPFMSTTLLSSALKHLTGDSAAIQQAKQMLQVCSQCRVNSTLQAQFPKISGNPK